MWAKHKTLIIVAVILILAVGGYIYWRKRKSQENSKDAMDDVPPPPGVHPVSGKIPKPGVDEPQLVAGVKVIDPKSDLKSTPKGIIPTAGQTITASTATKTYNRPDGTTTPKTTVAPGTVIGTATGQKAPMGWIEVREARSGGLKGTTICYVKNTEVR
jgi:hypothetical protein